MIVAATIVGVLGIRFNAVVTGLFLALELLVVITVAVTGFAHVHQPLNTLWSLQSFDAKGNVVPIGIGGMVGGIAIALFAYNGYDTAIVFSEETTGHSRLIGRAVVTAFLVALVAEVIPVTATLLGAPSLSSMVNSPAPFAYVMSADGGSTLNTIVSLGVALAIFNADIAAVLAIGRVIYSSGRDKAWPEPLNRWLGAVHPTLKTPWVATIVLGVASAALTAGSNIATLVTFVGVILCVLYALVAGSAIVSRYTQKTLERPYRMLIWPVPAVVALIGIALTLSQQKLSDLAIVAAILVVSAAYYYLYLRPRATTNWQSLKPLTSEAS
jgi:amino acid transporter